MLVSVLIGAELAGVIGALGAIPVAGAIQVVLVDWKRQRDLRRAAVTAVLAPPGEGEGLP